MVSESTFSYYSASFLHSPPPSWLKHHLRSIFSTWIHTFFFPESMGRLQLLAGFLHQKLACMAGNESVGCDLAAFSRGEKMVWEGVLLSECTFRFFFFWNGPQVYLFAGYMSLPYFFSTYFNVIIRCNIWIAQLNDNIWVVVPFSGSTFGVAGGNGSRFLHSPIHSLLAP